MFDRSLIAVIAVVVALGATTADSLTAEYQMIHAVNQADQARGGEPRPDPAVVQPFPGAEIPATILPSKVIGRWGWASFHQPEDRARTEASARDQCTNLPYSIDQGPKGGVMMHLPDQIEKVELRLKGGPGGRNFIGPAGHPGGASRDLEILFFDGRVMVLRALDPEVVGRYGTGVFVRCEVREGRRRNTFTFVSGRGPRPAPPRFAAAVKVT